MTFPEGYVLYSEVVSKFACGIKGWCLRSKECMNRLQGAKIRKGRVERG